MFTITAYSRAGARLEEVDAPLYATLTAVFNARGSLEFEIPSDAPVQQYLAEDGARIVVEWDGGVWSGPISSESGDVLDDGSITYQVRDDWGVVMDMPVPVHSGNGVEAKSLTDLAQAVPVGGQAAGTVDGQAGHLLWPSQTMTVEAAVKWLLRTTAEFYGRRLSVAPDKGRGGRAALPEVRFGTLEEVTKEMLAGSGLGLSIAQKPNESIVTADVWVTETYAQDVTPESNIIVSGRYSRKRFPDATRVIVGGPGDDAARAFVSKIDPVLETVYGPVPVFKDSTGAPLVWPKDLDDRFKVPKYYQLRTDVAQVDKDAFRKPLNEAAAEVLAEGALTSGLDVVLDDTESFYVGVRDGARGFMLGDLIPVRVRSLPFTERIRQVIVSLTADDGEEITPVFGTTSDDPDQKLYGAVAALQRAQNKSATSR